MRRLICATVFLAILVGNPAGAATKYVIKDLGVLPGTLSSMADSINSKGEIVGTSEILPWNREGRTPVSRVFLWRDGRMSEVKLPGEDQDFLGADINDSGQILAMTSKTSFIVQGDSAKRIEGLPGFPEVYATDMNNRTQVVGLCSKGKGSVQPFLRTNGIMKELTIPSQCGCGSDIVVSEKGQAAGTMDEWKAACPQRDG